MKKIMLMMSVIVMSNVFCHDNNTWIKKVGRKVVFGLTEYKGEYFFDDDEIDKFCERSKEYLADYMEDSEKYKCKNIDAYNKTYCSVLEKELSRHLNSEFPFGLELNPYLKFSFIANDLDIDELRRRLSVKHNVNESDLIFSGNLENIESHQIKIENRYEGFFTKLLNLTKRKSYVEADDYIGQGYANNRYTACSIIEKENNVIAEKKRVQKEIFEKVDAGQVSSMWSIYQSLAYFWNSNMMQKKKSDLTRLLFLGAKMKELESKYLNLELRFRGSEHWFDSFFTMKNRKNKISIKPKSFLSKNSFEEKLFPAKKHIVIFNIRLIEGGK